MKFPKAYNLRKVAAATKVRAKVEVQASSELDFTTWLPFAADTYKISPNISDYVLRKIPLCPSDIPNRNGIAFPLQELIKYQPPPTNRQVYKAWAGCPVHIEHCFVGDTRISTSKGLKKIADIELGDKVLTHKGRYRKVLKLYRNGIKPTTMIRAVGLTRPLEVTDNHPLWVVGRGQINQGGVKESRYRAPDVNEVTPHFRPVSDIYQLDYLVTHIDIGGNVAVSNDFAFLTGLYMAEGSINGNRTTFTLAYYEAELLAKAVSCAKSLGLNYDTRHHKSRGIATLVVKDSEFAASMLELCGKYSHKKRMRGELRKWNEDGLRSFLAGYASGDGSTKGPRLRIRTTSEGLAHDVQKAFGFLGIPASANGGGTWSGQFADNQYTKSGSVRKGLGGKPYRDCVDSFVIGVSFSELSSFADLFIGKKFKNRKKIREIGPKIIVVDGYILLPISHKESWGDEEVYNIEVEEDNTYIANGVVAHNCNENPETAIGVILDVSLTPIKGFNGGAHWKVMGLIAIDRLKAPEYAARVESGDLKTGSMGATAESFTCSVCNADAFDTEHKHKNCKHITSIEDVNWRVIMEDGTPKVVFLNAHGITPVEYSLVEDPAWCMSLSDDAFTL